MANFTYAGNGLYTGASTDTKVTAPAGYISRETDTGDEFVSDGTFWWLKGMPSPLSSRKIGWLWWGRTITGAGGLMNDFTVRTGTLGASNNTSSMDTTNGKYVTIQTGTTSTGGGNRVNVNSLLRKFNPRMRFRFNLVDTTNHRGWIGFIATAEPTGDDALASLNGVAFGWSTSLGSPKNANWVVWHGNSGGASTTVADDSGTAFNGNVHTVSLVADEANTRFSWSLDGGSYNHITSTIPGASNSLAIILMNENTDSATNKSVRIYDMMVQTDK